jgi:rubrerythrin
MLSPRSIFEEIRANDEAFRLFCSLASKNEHQGGWENERIAALTRDAELAGKIARHGADEDKHGRLFATLLKKRGLDPVAVPADTDYTMLLEGKGIGLPHARLHRDETLSDREILVYLIHSRVTEQRAHEEIEQQKEIFCDDPELGKAVRLIADDELNHLAYCHEELLRFSALGYGEEIRRTLRHYARVEVDTYRDVAIATMTRFGDLLGWSSLKKAALRLGIRAIWLSERLWRWRRMVELRPPERKNAMAPLGPPDTAGLQADAG